MKLFDLHCDSLYRGYTEDQPLGENSFHLDVKRGKKFGQWSQCFAVWIPDELRGKEAMALFDGCYEKFCRELEPCRSESFSPILTVEGGAVLGGELNNLRALKSRGVKMMTLTWNGENELGGGASTTLGLTPFGRETVKAMEELSIAVDVSHASDALFYDVAEMAEKSMVASHSNSRAVCPHPRNLTDQQFQILRNQGGLVGLNFCIHFLREDSNAHLEDILRHADHFWSLGGEAVLCLGSDYDGTDVPPELDGIEKMPDLYELFLKHNYKESLIKSLFFDNASKFFATL